ncbi:hypothetical protein PVAG01_09786 [Phlyctema vagabunda]|uniref:Uncharacterized protein n=1 Tax=Phlyctema vagabunda TaxID=108571 RepID=A0ABR4P4Q4_9HELO
MLRFSPAAEYASSLTPGMLIEAYQIYLEDIIRLLCQIWYQQLNTLDQHLVDLIITFGERGKRSKGKGKAKSKSQGAEQGNATGSGKNKDLTGLSPPKHGKRRRHGKACSSDGSEHSEESFPEVKRGTKSKATWICVRTPRF